MVKHPAKWSLAIAALCLLAATLAASPRTRWTGSIRAGGKKSIALLRKQAKITPEQAARIALAAVPGRDKKVLENELEIENGYLVYCVDIKVANQRGEHEVLVDPATARILSRKLEIDEDDDRDEDD